MSDPEWRPEKLDLLASSKNGLITACRSPREGLLTEPVLAAGQRS
jgi:hypothetical protein